MQAIDGTIRATIDEALKSLDRPSFGGLAFSVPLEDRFEADTRAARSYRMWFEGLTAIIGLNFCLAIDYIFLKDVALLATVRMTMIVTPVAMVSNILVRRNPAAWLREGSVAVAMIVICFMNLVFEGNRTTAGTLFGSICVMITALFVGVVMRLRMPYTLASIVAMLLGYLWSLSHAATLHLSEMLMSASMMLIGLGIILVASYSLEREERRTYLLTLQRGIQTKELAAANEELQRLSLIDKLTGLPNRRAFEERFDRLWEKCLRKGLALSAVVIDVDHFKMVNDVYGHLYGDEVLKRIGTLLPQSLRSPEDMAARFGGEEFIILLAHAEPDIALTVAERARKLVETAGTPLNPATAGQAAMWITVSCGVSSCIPAEETTWTQLVGAADEALYAAKRRGRNRVEFRSCGDPHAAPEDLAGRVFFDETPKRFCA
jgi:diguanylate cyclase (GGDEF)-like protein